MAKSRLRTRFSPPAETPCLPPERVAAFETLPAGVRAARAAGMSYIVGIDRHGGGELRRGGADLVVADLAELLDASLGE